MLLAEAGSNTAIITAIIAAVASIIVAIITVGVTLFRRVGSVKDDTVQINNAVNHVTDGTTLVQRVTRNEIYTRSIAHDLVEYRDWQHRALSVIANQVGCEVPPPPKLTPPFFPAPEMPPAPNQE